MVDALKRKLKVPHRYVPYMEKHRLYEMFQDVIVNMIQVQPYDHILFMKERIKDNVKSKHYFSPRVIILAPPHIDTAALAAQLFKSTKLLVVLLEEVMSCQRSEKKRNESPSEILARNCAHVLETHHGCLGDHHRGWLFVDFPRTKEEAVSLQRKGILPTHTIQLYPSSFQASFTFMSPLATRMKNETITKAIESYRRNLLGLREAYQSTLIEIDIRDRSIEELAESLSKVILQPHHSGGQTVPRVVIIGSRGSGMKTQGKLLSERFKIIHVDFDDLLALIRIQDDDLAHKVRLWESYLMPVHTDVLAAVIERRLLESDCLDQGWVLTGYPTNLLQLESLYNMDTTPNKVIFLDVEPVTCMKRITLRGVNMYTGSQHNLLQHRHSTKPVDYTKVATHPKNETKLAKKQLCYYHANLNDMLTYAPGTEIVIDGNSTLRTVTERVQAAVMRPNPLVLEQEPSKRIITGSKKFSLQVADWVVRSVVEKSVREINAVEGTIDEMIERVMIKTERSHIISNLEKDVNRQRKLTRKPLVHFDEEYECLAIVRGIPRAKRQFNCTEYGKFIAAYEKRMREYDRVNEELLEAERKEKLLVDERKRSVQFMIDEVKAVSIAFVDELIATAIRKTIAIMKGAKRDVFVLGPLQIGISKPKKHKKERFY